MPFPTPSDPREVKTATERTVVHVLVHHYRCQGFSSFIIKKKLLSVDGWIVSEGTIRKMWSKELEEIVDRRGCGVGRPASRSPETKRIILGNPQMSVSAIQHKVKEERSSVGRGTISRTFHETGNGFEITTLLIRGITQDLPLPESSFLRQQMERGTS